MKKERISKILIIVIAVSSVTFFLINSTVRPMLELLLWWPLFAFMGLCTGTIFAFTLQVYNIIRKQYNLQQAKRNMNFRNCMEHIQAVEYNYQTVIQALTNRCTIPKDFHTKEALEAMLIFIKQGRANDLQHAMHIIRKEFPDMLNRQNRESTYPHFF